MAVKQKNKTLATGLKFIASLIFLYVVFVQSPAVVASAAGAVWAPVLYAVAVVGSVSLFFASLVSFVWSSEMLNMTGKKANMVVALALIAWAAISGPAMSMTMELALVGFVIGWFGAGAAEMK